MNSKTKHVHHQSDQTATSHQRKSLSKRNDKNKSKKIFSAEKPLLPHNVREKHWNLFSSNSECDPEDCAEINCKRNSLFYSSSEDERDESLFGTIFQEQPSTDTEEKITSLNSQRNASDSPMPKSFVSTEISTTSDIQVEDVSKVFKIISKSNILPNLKPSSRSALKTYCRFNKSLQTRNVIESFCLPDTPIVQEKPLNDKLLDVDVVDAKEVTIFFLPDHEESSVLQEVGSNGMLLDTQNIFKKEFHISTPEIKANSKVTNHTPKVTNHTPKKVKTRGNLVETMKNNIKRLLNDSQSSTDGKEGEILSTKKVEYSEVTMENSNIFEDEQSEVLTNLKTSCEISNKKVFCYSNKERHKNKNSLANTLSNENFRRKLRSSLRQEKLSNEDFEKSGTVTKTADKSKLKQKINVQSEEVYSPTKDIANLSPIQPSKLRLCLSQPRKCYTKSYTRKLLKSRSQDIPLSQDIVDKNKEHKNSELVVILQPISANNTDADHTPSSNQATINSQEQSSLKRVNSSLNNIGTQQINRPSCKFFNHKNIILNNLLSEWEVNESEVNEIEMNKIDVGNITHKKTMTGKNKQNNLGMRANDDNFESSQITEKSPEEKMNMVFNSCQGFITVDAKSCNNARKENVLEYSIERKNEDGLWHVDIETAKQLEICSKITFNDSDISETPEDLKLEFHKADSYKQNSTENNISLTVDKSRKKLLHLGKCLKLQEQMTVNILPNQDGINDTVRLDRVTEERKIMPNRKKDVTSLDHVTEERKIMLNKKKDVTKETAVQKNIQDDINRISESLKEVKYQKQKDVNLDDQISSLNAYEFPIEGNCTNLSKETVETWKNSVKSRKLHIMKPEQNDKFSIAQTELFLTDEKDDILHTYMNESADVQESKNAEISASNLQNINCIPQEEMETSSEKFDSVMVENSLPAASCDKKYNINSATVTAENSADTNNKGTSKIVINYAETVEPTDSANRNDLSYRYDENGDMYTEKTVKNKAKLQTNSTCKENVCITSVPVPKLEIAKSAHMKQETIKGAKEKYLLVENNSEQINELATKTSEIKSFGLKSPSKKTKNIAQKQKVDHTKGNINNKNTDKMITSKALILKQSDKTVSGLLETSLVVDNKLDLAQIEADVTETSEIINYTDVSNKNIAERITRSKSRMALRVVEDTDSEDSPETVKRLRSRTSMEMYAKGSSADSDDELKFDKTPAFMWKFIKEENLTRHIREKKENILRYRLGTLLWAHIGIYPYWPCFITRDNNSNEFRKIVIRRYPTIVCHVTFFGDNGKRAWINENKLIFYTGPNNLQTQFEIEKSKGKSHSQLQLYTVSERYLKNWEKAVEEAERVKNMTIRNKLNFIRETLSKPNVKEQNSSLEGLTNQTCGKRKRQSSSNKSLGNTSKKRSPVRKKTKLETKKINPDSTISKLNTTVEQSQREVNKSSETVLSFGFDNENILPSRLRDRKIDETSEVGSKASSENIKSDVYSLEAQKTLFKRNNLFKGVPKDKVCQYCFQPGEVYKCKGGCNGLYHVSCAAEVTDNKPVKNKRIKKRNSSLSLPEEIKPGSSCGQNRSVVVEKTENNLISKDNQSSERKSKTVSEDRVQIITVTSNIYNTPPRKTFPDNFEDMSLAERIDFKMKEVMKKFETQTTYSESIVESGSEENSAPRCDSQGSMSNIPVIRSIEEIVKLRHGAAEQKKIASQLDALQNSPKGLRKNIARKLKFPPRQHVTADSDVKITPSVMVHNNITPEKESAIYKTSSKKLSKNSNNHDETLEHSFSESCCSTVSQKEKINPKNFKCGFCNSNSEPFCFVCHLSESKKGSILRQKCSLYQCGRFYHLECLKFWPQTQWSLIQTTKHKSSNTECDSFVCPQHFCHSCISDDPRAANSRCPGDKIVRCLRCPSTYHSTNFCVPAGTEILSATQIICPRHRNRNVTINTTWCVLCNEGGNLICCETCPTSVHPECMPVNLTEDDRFICEDCESGRLPLHDEIVWVKLGKYKWWPALILFPNEVPQNVIYAKHSTGDFVVKFFGTYDYCWVNRGRSFLFQDGDTAQTSRKGKDDIKFLKAVEEAVVAHRAKEEFKKTQEVESLNSLKPPPYIKIKSNKPVGSVKLLDLDLSNLTPCECDPNQPNPCGPDSDCLNRLLLTECNPVVCPAGSKCKNQSFEKREYPPMAPYKTEGRGWGLKSLAPIKKGQFVIEYVGELIDEAEYQRRLQKMSEQKEENYYFLTIDKDVMIDAGPKGNMARFMNHCCQPNCETQKWTVNGNTRVGLFAKVDIPADIELTFNYNLECIGKEKKVCRCGAPNCSGYIGVKAKQDTESKKPKKVHKKKKLVEQVVLPPCFICKRRGNVVLCTNKMCNKAYHLKCLNISDSSEGSKFICSWHNCNICSKRTIRCCVKCINSFCPSHSESNIRYDNLLGFLCSNHDTIKPTQSDQIMKIRKRTNNTVTEESTVTSTTSDDSDEGADIPLLDRRLKRKVKTNSKRNVDEYSDNTSEPLSDRWLKRKFKSQTEEHSVQEFEDISLSDKWLKRRSTTQVHENCEVEFEVASHSTPLRKLESENQGENVVSSASSSNLFEGRCLRKNRKKNDQIKKKFKLDNVRNNISTASSDLSSTQYHLSER